ncbi:hypothetical protein [Streptacidiphilus cavernicola]|uniref:PPM-type phosphatase domain-containing protein n=1 Tax=Streptacidiphilus cavernicola TaxID=3342716 RepID=A0ABV6VRB3_9ACTN
MSSQGEPSSGKGDGGWWDAVYQGPDDEVPDTPGADTRQGSVDDWFASASGMISGGAAADAAAGTTPGTASGAAPGQVPAGPPTLVQDTARRPAQPAVPGQGTPPERETPPGRVTPPAPRSSEPPASEQPPAGVPAPPVLPPLPVRPPRIPPQAVDPRVSPSRPSLPGDPRGAYVPERYNPDPDLDPYGADPDPDPYDADAFGPDGLDSEVHDEPYQEPRAVREARTGAPDRPVRDLDQVREANEAEAAVAAALAAEAEQEGPFDAPPAPSSTAPSSTAPSPTLAGSSASGRSADAAPDPTLAGPLPQVGEQPPAYEPEPTLLPAADPDLLTGIVPDTALDGARYGSMTLRAASVRGDAARHLGTARSDRMLVVRFGEGSEALLVVVLATPPGPESAAPADEACRQLAAAVGRSRAELLADLRVGAQERLRYGLQRLTARAAVRLQNVPYPERGSGGALHALIAPLDPTSRLRAGFGLGPGGLLLLGDDAWYDAYAGRRLVAQQPGGGSAAASGVSPAPDRFRFRVVAPEPGDVLLLCSDGLAQPLREEPAVSDFLADHWAHPHPPGTVDFLRQVQVRAKGYAADRTAAAIWED